MKTGRKFAFIYSLLFALSIAGCADSKPITPSIVENDYHGIYQLYVSDGGTLNYDAWLNSIRGADGFVVLSGEGIPSISNGKNGDVYIDLSSWDIYCKNGGNWFMIGNSLGHEPTPTSKEKTAYEMYLETHPEYTGSEEEWLDDLINDKLNKNEYHVVSFDTDGGSFVPNQNVLHGEKIVEPEDPTKDGFTFQGWFYHDEPWVFYGYVVTEDITLSAQWEAEPVPEVTVDGKLKISMRNLYFADYSGGDYYLSQLEDKFAVKFELSSYSWFDWDAQVNGQVNGGTLSDTFHANIDSFNIKNTYEHWAKEELIKPLPDDLSYWPNLKRMIENTTNINALKIDGKLYGIPVAKNTTDYSTTFSPFTYIYRRDWAKKFGVYQENDVYTWDQFLELLNTFSANLNSEQYALGDAEWGFPSIINFYKQHAGCFAYDEESNKYVNNYLTDSFLNGLETTRTFINNGWYYPNQYASSDGELNRKYIGNGIGVLYENLSYSNYYSLKHQLEKNNRHSQDFNIDDAVAIMKINGPDGKYVLEGAENWYSMTLFNENISDAKMYKILDILDWLLSEEGTRYSIYGEEGYDYTIIDEEIQLVDAYWPKTTDGSYARKDNGAKYLRYLVSLGYDTLSYDPLTDKSVVSYLASWEEEMKNNISLNSVRILKENDEVKWLNTELKSDYNEYMQANANNSVLRYVYSTITLDQYRDSFTKIWADVLTEINTSIKYY